MFAVYQFNKISIFLLLIPRKGHCYMLIEQNRVHGVEKECGIIFFTKFLAEFYKGINYCIEST